MKTNIYYIENTVPSEVCDEFNTIILNKVKPEEAPTTMGRFFSSSIALPSARRSGLKATSTFLFLDRILLITFFVIPGGIVLFIKINWSSQR